MADLVMNDEDLSGRSDLEEAIAEQIAHLSSVSDTPDEFEPPGHAFEAEEVDFGSAVWMACLAEVQGWLRLPEELRLDDQKRFLDALARGLELDPPAVVLEEQAPLRLVDAALERLNGRLQQAIRLQEQYIADLETDGSTTRSATGRWIAAWDDGEAEDEPGSGPVSAAAETWAINEFSGRASDGQLNLSPSYQRGDVWPTSDSQQLIESILRGIPLPSVIILRPADPNRPYEVVDGKQRLTSILRFIGQHPRALEVVDQADQDHPGYEFRKLFETDYPKFRRKWKNIVGDQLGAATERANYFPFKLRTGATSLQGELSPLQGKYYTQIKEELVQIADVTVAVRQLFERMTKYKIPVIEYSKATRQQIHEVFNLYNKQGKHLNAEEIRNALYHDVKFMRAILVVAGDNEDVDEVAPFLRPSWDRLSETGQTLKDYGIGVARYRRSKVLSWLSAMLLFDSMENGKPKRLATARHIDSLLQRIQNNAQDPLTSTHRIDDAFNLLLTGMEAHAAVYEAWAPNFRDTKTGAKWQELQLIASVLGVTIAAAVLGEKVEDRLSDVATSLYEKTTSSSWQRPPKTQTATQWTYIARIAVRVVEELRVDLDEASTRLTDRFGYSGVPTLRAVLAESGGS